MIAGLALGSMHTTEVPSSAPWSPKANSCETAFLWGSRVASSTNSPAQTSALVLSETCACNETAEEVNALTLSCVPIGSLSNTPPTPVSKPSEDGHGVANPEAVTLGREDSGGPMSPTD